MKKLTTQEFKDRLVNIFGTKYCLDKVEYIDSKTKVTLTCEEHGDFSALPHNLLAHKGCPKCRYVSSSNKIRRSLEEVLALSNEKHNFKYDYSLISEYKNNTTKYPIICHEKDDNGVEHGVFYQDFEHHLSRGHCCPKCKGNAKGTTEGFIKRAVEVHGDKYNYSMVEYKGIHTKVCIVCPVHGEFWQTPNDHLHGKGCPKCKGKKIWDKRGRLTVEDVKKRFEMVHGKEYDYSMFTEYKNNRTKIPVICKTHGVFYISPNNHLMGRGCPLCRPNKISEKQRLPIDEVIKRIKEVHGDKYLIPIDFEYKNNIDKVKLICPIHGEFQQNPINLWRGVGCPKCNKSKLENEVSLMLDREGIEYEEQKRFEWLKNYELDFYIPRYKVAIECQGIQHFKPIALFGGEEQFKQQNIWDDEKHKLCEENGIKVLYYTTNGLMKSNSDYRYDLLSGEKELLNEIKPIIV